MSAGPGGSDASRPLSGTPWLEADWPAPPGVRALVTLRHGAGASAPPFDSFNLGNARAGGGDAPATVAANRAALVEQARLPSAPHWLRQVHGQRVLPVVERLPPGDATVERSRMAAEPEADAAATDVPGVVLGILSADCLPVVLAAREGGEIAAAHAGWRGLAGGVLEATLAGMRTPASRVVAWLGPAAGPGAYEVAFEVREAFVDADPDSASAFVPSRPGHWHVDLYALARRRLRAAGLASANIHGGKLCTISDAARFFSHRRDGRSGRMATLIWME